MWALNALARVLGFPAAGDEAGGAGESSSARQRAEAAEIGKIVAGEVDRFEYFVKTYQKRIFRLAYTLLRDPAEADGVTQDVFVKAYRALADFKGESAFETWLTRIAINTVRDVVRRRKPVVLFSELHGDGEDDGPELPASLDPADGTSAERDLMSREIRRRLGRRSRDALAPAAGGLRDEALRGTVDRRNRPRRPGSTKGRSNPTYSARPASCGAAGGPPMRTTGEPT